MPPPEGQPNVPLPDGRTLTLDRPRIMGILNVTPDSFSDGGRFVGVDAAVTHAQRMAREGADILDIGGESTRPGSQGVPPPEQARRVVPVIEELVARIEGVVISVDTSSAAVAEAALDAGAVIVNDVTAARGDPDMLLLAAERGCPIVLMHMQGTPGSMQDAPRYGDVVAEVCAFLLDRANTAQAAGVVKDRILIDPGIGFGKTKSHNLALLANLDKLVALGFPVLLGTSRKRFMGAICTEPDGSTPQPDELVGATCATTALGVAKGVRLFRVHDVQANRQAADVAYHML
ncbi:MAG: dihydropteroate synthase [Phycisphaera sp.]|nr:dihydropteroate synthase [Phycisphaera sp.]